MSCIQMKLNEQVSDTNMRKLDEWVIHVNAPNKNRRMDIHAYGLGSTPEVINVRIIGDGVLYTDDTYTTELGKTTTLSTANGWILYLGEGEYDIYLSNKYKITYMKTMPDGVFYQYQLSIDCRYLSYEEYWGQLDLNGVRLENFDRYAINKLYDVRLYNCQLNCDVTLFVERLSPDVTMTRFILSNDSTITGDATELGTLPIWSSSPNGTIISCRKEASTPEQNFTGTYSEFCDKVFAAGKTSGTLRVHMPDDPESDDPYLITFSASGWTR